MKDKQQIFEEFTTHLLEDDQPSQYFENIYFNEMEVVPFSYLKKLKETEQSKQYHAEGNVWNHTMLVVDEAAKVRIKSHDKKVFMWAALLHDIGKPDTTKNRKGKIISYGHEEVGAVLTEKFLNELTNDKEFIRKVCSLVRWHMQILFVVKDLPYKNINKMKEDVDMNEIALIGWCDRMGRKGSDYETERKNIQLFLRKYNE